MPWSHRPREASRMYAHLRRTKTLYGSGLLAATLSFRGVFGLAPVSFFGGLVVDPSSLHITNTGKRCRKNLRGPHRNLHTDPYPVVPRVRPHLHRILPQRRAVAYFRGLSQRRYAGSAQERRGKRRRKSSRRRQKIQRLYLELKNNPSQCLPRASCFTV
jgi:hypothetical protein